MKKRLFVLVLLFMLCSTNVCAETSTRYTLDEIGMSISFPKDFDVFTRNMPDDSQVFLDYDLNSKEVNEILIPNNIYLLALSEDGNKEIDVAMTDNSISDFSKFSDNVLNTMASMLIEEYKKAGVVIEKYDIYHSGYITYVRMWERYNDMPNHIALQYYTVHECQAINIIMHSFSGGITAADEITMLDIVNGVVFGDRKDSTVVYKTSTDPTHFSYEILSDGTAKITGYMGLQASISIPESIDGHVITSIGKMDKNYTVSTVFIPATVKSMEGNPFVDLSVLKAIDVDEKNTSYIAEDGVLYTYDKKELVCYPKNRKNETFVVPSETDIVGENAFNNVYLFYVELSEGVEVIEQDAFAHAVGITNIYLPKTIKRIDGNPFNYSPSLMSISVDPKNPYFYAQDGVLFNRRERMLQAFPDNKAIEHYTIPEGIISVGEDAFNNHSGNAMITFPKSLRKIGAGAFASCSGFEFPELTSNLIQIDEFAFDGCNTIESVKIHSDAIIGKRAFGDCGGLKSVYIEEGITEVSDYMFFACESLQEVELPSTLASIGEHAFRMCESLEILTIPASVEYIGERAFDDCSKLVIQVKEGSYAAQYCQSNNLKFKYYSESKKTVDRDEYHDPVSGISFLLPVGWIQKEMSEERKSIDAKFVPEKADGSSIIYTCEDAWMTISEVERYNLESIGASRKDIDNSIITVDDIADIFSIDSADVFVVNYSNQDFFTSDITTKQDFLGYSIPLESTILFCMRNGYLHGFQFFGLLNDCIISEMMNSIVW